MGAAKAVGVEENASSMRIVASGVVVSRFIRGGGGEVVRPIAAFLRKPKDCSAVVGGVEWDEGCSRRSYSKTSRLDMVRSLV